jgi:hypothetical protein
MTAVETGGTWSPATSLQDLPANATLGEYEVAQLDSAWCSSIGNCVVAGTYNPMDGEPVAYTASEVDGVWQTAKEVPMPAGAFSVGFVLGFSCASTSSCILLDSFESNSTRTWGVYTSTLADGSWSTPQVYIPAILKINTWLGGTCYAIELCIAGGFGKDNLTSGGAPVVAVFDTGTWKGATFLPLPRLSPVEAGGEIFDISCPSATECVAVGDLNPEFSSSAGRIPAVYTWSHGTWSSANVLHVVLAPSTKPWDSILTSVACPSTSNCTALGLAILRDTDSSPWDPYAVAIAPVETIGSPGAPTEVTGNSSGSKLTVTWEPPLSDGGSSIASFRIKVIGPGTHAAGCTTVSRSCSFSGVVKDKTYSIEASDLSRAGKRSAESSARLLVH